MQSLAPSRPKYWAWMIRLAAIGLLGISLAGFLGGAHWVLDLTANWRLQYLLAGGALLVLAAVRADTASLAAVGAALAVNVLAVAPLFVGSAGEADPNADPLRVVTFNIWEENEQLDEVAEFLRGTEADVIFLHEVTRRSRRVLDAGTVPYEYVAFDRHVSGGTTVLVRPDLAVEPSTLQIGRYQRFPVVEIDYAGSTVELVGIHPISPISGRRSVARDRTLTEIGAWVVGRPGEVIVAGDFNATPWTVGYRDFAATSGLVSSIDGAGWQGSWPNAWQLLQIPIDHLFHSPGLATVARDVGPHAGSDHAAVIVDLAPAA